jgi:hypothetical protein
MKRNEERHSGFRGVYAPGAAGFFCPYGAAFSAQEFDYVVPGGGGVYFYAKRGVSVFFEGLFG